MANTTRWIFKYDEEYEQKSMFEYLVDKLNSLSDKTLVNSSRTERLENFEVIESNEKNDEIKYNDKKIKYFFTNIKFNKVDTENDDYTEVRQNIILYELNGNVNLIIDKNTGTLTFLRTIFEITKNKAIEQVSTFVNSDFIIWCIYKVYTKDVTYQINETELSLDAVIGFKGDTEDELNKITATGDTLLNILSALSFLLESSKLNQVSLRMSYKDNANIEMTLTNKNIISVNFSTYKGIFKKEEYTEYSDLHKHTLVTLLMYLEIMPILKNWYEDSKEDNKIQQENNSGNEMSDEIIVWNNKEHKRFLEKVGEDLTKKIKSKINSDLTT